MGDEEHGRSLSPLLRRVVPTKTCTFLFSLRVQLREKGVFQKKKRVERGSGENEYRKVRQERSRGTQTNPQQC